MGNPATLVNLGTMDPEKAREIQRKGGKARGKQMTQQKIFRQVFSGLLDQSTAMGKDNAKEMAMAMIREAMDGNTKAFEVVRDTMGEKPTDKVEQDINVNDGKLNDIMKALNDGVQ